MGLPVGPVKATWISCTSSIPPLPAQLELDNRLAVLCALAMSHAWLEPSTMEPTLLVKLVPPSQPALLELESMLAQALPHATPLVTSTALFAILEPSTTLAAR